MKTLPPKMRMLRYLQRLFPRWSLQRQIDKLHREYDQEITRLQRTGASGADHLADEAFWNEIELKEELDEAQSHWLQKKARHFYINPPVLEWQDGKFGSRFLTDDSRSKLNAAVREHEDKRHEFYIKVLGVLVGLITAATGLVGAGIGLLAFLKKK